MFRPAQYQALPQNVGVTTKRTRKRTRIIRGIVAARRKAVDYIYANPKEAAKLIVRNSVTECRSSMTRAIEHAVEL